MWTTRKEQMEPEGKWLLWLILAGRGFGKTRTGAETIRMWIEEQRYKYIGFIGYSELEVRKVMVEGISGIITVSENSLCTPKYLPSKRVISYDNGTYIHLFSADNPDQLRGSELDAIWIDEFAKFKNPEYLWHQATMTLRKSKLPKVICTTTPRPLKILRDFIADTDNVHVTRGSTYDNAQNLSPLFLSMINKYYANTNFEKQEIYGEILDEGDALFNADMIEYAHTENTQPKYYDGIVLGVDPAVSVSQNSDESGMLLVGIKNNIYYIIEDASGKYSPHTWANKIVDIYRQYRCLIVIETNNGGDFLSHAIHLIDPCIRIIKKRAVDSKVERAYSISVLYSQGKIKHTKSFMQLEDQLLNYHYCKSPDRIDALIWAINELRMRYRKYSY